MKAKRATKRLDALLVQRGLADSTKAAQSMILAGEIQVNGIRTEKAGTKVAEDAEITVIGRGAKYASRGGIKLEGALDDFALKVAGRVCLDIGSSTGGFTDCLLHRGATRVYAVDVNVAQLDWKLRQDSRVVPIQRNARELRAEDIPEDVDVVVIDVSFISATKVLKPAFACAKTGADFLILVKPQFELPREDVPAGGVVTDTSLREKAITIVANAAAEIGLHILGTKISRLPGAEGNQEHFLYARKVR